MTVMACYEKQSHLQVFVSSLRQSHGVATEVEVANREEPANTVQVSLGGPPIYVQHKETTNSELFYDLFFVANLAVFGTVKEVTDTTTLSQYIGFFGVIWFTWYQVAMYDVRFTVDSLFNRVARVIQLGVMIGFAISGPTFNPGATLEEIINSDDNIPNQIPDPNLVAFKTITLVMMVSRLTLTLQYLQSLWFSRRYKETQLPLALIAFTYLAAAVVYGCLFLAFKRYQIDSYIAWYVGSILETMVCTAVSCHWRLISFKGTHLEQRMSLLTLIIIGEGILGLAERCQAIVKGRMFFFDSSTVGDIVAGVLIIYFIYILYFDWITEEHMGSVRQQVWSFLHFPLHLALVLSLQGANQFIAWRAATVAADHLFYDSFDSVILSINATSTEATFRAASVAVQNATDNFIKLAALSAQGYSAFSQLDQANTSIYGSLAELNATHSGDTETALDLVAIVYAKLATTLYSSIGFDASHRSVQSGNLTTSAIALEEVTQELLGIFSIAQKTLNYFFVCLGGFLILQGFLVWYKKRNKSSTDRVRLGCNFILGLAICLVTLLDTNLGEPGRTAAYANYVQSPWILPTAVLSLFIVVVVHNIPIPFTRKQYA